MHQFEGDEYQTVERKQTLFSDSRLRLVTAVLLLVTAILNLFGRSQKVMWLLGILSGLLFLWIVGFWILSLVRRFGHRYSNRRYVAKEYPKLQGLFDRLCFLAGREDMRSFRFLLYNASAYRVAFIDQICGSDYIEAWIRCFSQVLANPCNSIPDFLARCSEFTTIVTEFNKGYVSKTQAALEKDTSVPGNFFDSFEEFRQRFVLFLHELEQWSDAIAKEAQKRLPPAEFLRRIPHRSFEIPKQFRRIKSEAVGA